MTEGPNQVFETIWAQAAKVFSAEAFSVALCGPGPNQITYELVVDRGVRQVPQTSDLGDGLSQLVVRSGKPVLVRDFELEDGTMPLSWMGAPMLNGDRVIGLLIIQASRPDAFERRDLSVLSMLANWAAFAVDSSQRFQTQQQEAEAASALLQAARVLGRETDPDGLFRAVAETASTVVDCVRCSVWLWSADDQHFAPMWRSSVGKRKAEQFTSAPMRPTEIPAVVDMLRSQDVVVVGENESALLGVVGDALPLGLRSIALVPLARDGEIVAQMVIVRSSSGEEFTSKEIDMLRGFADIVGLTLNNLRQHKQAGEAAALREVSEVKSRLISTISHELRTPLSFVQAGSELLMQRLFEPDQLRQVAGLVNQGSLRLAEVVDDIIEFADLQSGTVQLTLLSANPVTVVRDAIEDAAGPAHGHRVALEATEPLPKVKMDGQKLKAVVVRLVRNALNFSQDPASVTVRLSADVDRLRVEVSDSGFGIPAEEVEKVFDPFFRGEVSQARCIPGTGLGLSIVKQLVDTMGGEVSMQSKVDSGTT
ncbi:MAG TPA: GAF domain-containing sensor histidine kinase, partial [Chloroflexota bacterium]|nr:GAF domain-containing sensor histidine kinase [Chloroflexota bacterium]